MEKATYVITNGKVYLLPPNDNVFKDQLKFTKSVDSALWLSGIDVANQLIESLNLDGFYVVEVL